MTDIPHFILYLACLMFLRSCHKQTVDAGPRVSLQMRLSPKWFHNHLMTYIGILALKVFQNNGMEDCTLGG
ncbi:hypothetical protein BDV27DRAFT_122649 [Aspergillus caelatus]|uniref:Uncharacterized protein n=1 Tax=Aspergillus caelatus TaxID=61420 RepID=A0A5N7AET9_9EURO|nr:uncharacterized protein BDV27DRAFT_122649 [Aspergillus caelatus]KAE8368183.1 hypothetical protein BDV27DRAFT_122649 [Aspergillus caelatus]